jgi:hypothetical protein
MSILKRVLAVLSMGNALGARLQLCSHIMMVVIVSLSEIRIGEGAGKPIGTLFSPLLTLAKFGIHG